MVNYNLPVEGRGIGFGAGKGIEPSFKLGESLSFLRIELIDPTFGDAYDVSRPTERGKVAAVRNAVLRTMVDDSSQAKTRFDSLHPPKSNARVLRR